MELLDQLQPRVRNMINGQEHLSYKEKLTAGPIQPQEEMTDRRTCRCIQVCDRKVSRGWTRLFLVVLNNWKRGNRQKPMHRNSTWTQGKYSLLWRWPTEHWYQIDRFQLLLFCNSVIVKSKESTEKKINSSWGYIIFISRRMISMCIYQKTGKVINCKA